MTRRPSAPRGFTLIELMIVVAIIGILATIAMPELGKSSLRARATERALVSRAIVKAIEDHYASTGSVTMTGTFNPPGVPNTTKRPLDWTQADWKPIALRLTIEGNLYYSYSATTVDTSNPPTLELVAQGDLDGDGALSVKTWHYERRDGAYVLTSETPPAGQEDVYTF